MRIDLPSSVIAILRHKDTPQAVRVAVAALWIDPLPADKLTVEDKPDRYEIFESGFWIVYEVKQDRGETVVRVLDIAPN